MQSFKVIFMIMVFFSIQGLSALGDTSTPGNSTSDTSTPGNSTSDTSTSDTSTPGNSTSDNSTPGNSTSDTSTSDTSTPGNSTSDTSTPGNSTSDTSTPGNSTSDTSGECAIETDNKENLELLNTLPAVNILNLSGQDCTGLAIDRFVIRTLPNAEAGTLYLADSETEVFVDQFLSIEESDGLRFDPNEDFEGEATFTYASVGNDEVVDTTPATVSLGIVASSQRNDDCNATEGNVADTADCKCEDYETSIPTLSKLGLFAMFILSAFLGVFFMRKETSL